MRERFEALPDEERWRRLQDKRDEVFKRLPAAAAWSSEAIDNYAEASLYRDLSREVPLLSFEEFQRVRQGRESPTEGN
jgi:hypothetical protein